MKQVKRFFILFLCLLFPLMTSGCQQEDHSETQQAFDAFIEEQFKEVMMQDYVSMHILLEDPNAFGIDASKVKVSLGEIDEDKLREIEKKSKATWEEFQSFERSHLTKEQQDTYDIYEYQESLNQKLSDDKFEYYPSLYSSMKGIHHQLPTLFSDWTLRNEQDVKDLITLVKDVKPYIDETLDYTKEQAKQGLLMVDLSEVIEYCEGIVKQGMNSAILASMKESIDALALVNASSYKQELSDAFQTSFLPAYEAIIQTMEELKSAKNNTEGLMNFPHGKEYYSLILQQNIGSYKSVGEVKKMMKDCYDQHLRKLAIMMMKDESLFDEFAKPEPKTPFTSYEEILAHIESRFYQDFPKGEPLHYKIKDIHKEIASDNGTAAYFNIPALDDSRPRQLRVNPLSSDVSSISTFQTVAHEGFPGHMYQFNYMYGKLDSNYRKALADSLAYTEGYAVYTQFYANQYIPDIDQTYLECLKENELASYNVIMLADIGIHDEGWSVKDFASFLEQNGFQLEEEAYRLQYQQLQQNPAVFAPYYVGYEEISAFKQQAQQALDEDFVDQEFHEALLESGTAPFTVVKRHIDAYIKQHT